jgi:hypothetical protein
MPVTKFTCPPQASGQGSFSDNLVGFQLVDGGGFTQGNFEFTTAITEKQNRTFEIGTFSDPISLETMNISDIEQSKMIIANNLQVYPNYDLSQITNFTSYGSLVLRLSAAITKIINFFPAGLQVSPIKIDFSTGYTVTNILYDEVEDETTLEIYLDTIRNPFAIDFSINADRNSAAYEFTTSELRNMKKNYLKYGLFINGEQYPINDIQPVRSTDTTFKIYVKGQPFPNQYFSSASFLVRPTDFYVNKVFSDDFDTVENFLLNRQNQPIYTSYFQVPRENEDGTYTFTYETLKFPVQGDWNLDISSNSFQNYIDKLNNFGINLDQYTTNLISRFYTTGSLKEFDTIDRKFEKVIQIYGRSFDETKQFIGTLANINSVNYNVKNDIPSQLLKNLALTLGWKTNISPITETNFLNSIFTTSDSNFSGVPVGQTPDELNYQYYRNLILNSAFLFKSKGTRKSIEVLLRFIGAPDFLVDFNEYVYLADQRISLNDFETQYAKISGGTYTQTTAVLDPTDVYTIMGVQYTGFTTTSTITDISITQDAYPLDQFGCPSTPVDSESYYFQIGGGWFESTPQHRMPEQIDLTTSVFTGTNPNYQTKLRPFNYGEEYLDRYRYFPYMNLGFRLRRTQDNKKSWTDTQVGLRSNSDANFNAYYPTSEDCLVLNVKNVDIMLNPSLGLAYDVWTMSRRYNYPIPNEGLNYVEPTYCNPNPNTPYPRRGGIDWTEIIPKPKEKTFFEFLQTFWKNTINVRNRQFITDGKTGGYPTLQSIYWKYLESRKIAGLPNDNFTYQPLIDYVNGLGDYWIRLVEQMVPATTIWNTGVRLENSIFHRQKFVWRRQFGCKIVPIPCNPCELTAQIFAYDCPTQIVECPLYPWNADPTYNTFGDLLAIVIKNKIAPSGLTLNDCQLNTVTANWFADIRYDGVPLVIQPFATTVGYNSYPTNQQWIDGLNIALTSLQNSGYNYFIDEDNQKISVYNVNCIALENNDLFQINVGINFTILCNQ